MQLGIWASLRLVQIDYLTLVNFQIRATISFFYKIYVFLQFRICFE